MSFSEHLIALRERISKYPTQISAEESISVGQEWDEIIGLAKGAETLHELCEKNLNDAEETLEEAKMILAQDRAEYEALQKKMDEIERKSSEVMRMVLGPN